MKAKKCLILISVLFLLPSLSFAGSGQATIPHFDAKFSSIDSYKQLILYVSNITDDTVSVKITLYDTTGSILQDGDDDQSTGTFQTNYNTLPNYDDDPSGASVSFDLYEKNTGLIFVRPSSQLVGYGVIEWTQSGSETQALVVQGRQLYRQTTNSEFGQYAVQINEGKPF